MKKTVTDANLPKTSNGEVYHLGIKYGEVANRIVTVGMASRAEQLARFLDASPKPFSLYSERGFLTITGRYRGTPMSIMCIGMGGPNVDFFIREARECLHGDMLIIRLGSCGCLSNLPVGSVVLPKASIAITRNLDFDFANGDPWRVPYILSKSIPADTALVTTLQHALESTRPRDASELIVSNSVNASTDSFYSSQGRQTSFQDHNSELIMQLKETIQDIATLEMETYWILHLAASWQGRLGSPVLTPPLVAGAVHPTTSSHPGIATVPPHGSQPVQPMTKSSIRAAAVQMVFASRSSRNFITPEQVYQLEAWCGRAVLEALRATDIPSDRLHPEEGSVWDIKASPLKAAL